MADCRNALQIQALNSMRVGPPSGPSQPYNQQHNGTQYFYGNQLCVSGSYAPTPNICYSTYGQPRFFFSLYPGCFMGAFNPPTTTNPDFSACANLTGPTQIMIVWSAFGATGAYCTTFAPVTPPSLNSSLISVCKGNFSQLTVSVIAPNSTLSIQWSSSNPFIASVDGSGLVTGGNPGTATITATVTDVVCTQSLTATVNVSSGPSINASASTPTICAGGQTTLTAYGASTYIWTDINNSWWTSNANPVTVTPAATTTYRVTGTTSGCTSVPASVFVTVNSKPTVTASASEPTICAGQSTRLTASGATSYSWNTGATGSSIVVSPTVTTTYTVTGTLNGCTSDPYPVTVTVNTKPAAPTVMPVTICTGTTATLTAIAPSGATFKWYNPINTLLFTGNPYTPAPTTTITYYIESVVNNCTSATKTPVTVTVNPKGQVNQQSNQTVCAGSAAAPVIFATTNTVGTTTYAWTNNNTGIGLAASGSGNIPAFTAINTGGSPITATITVTPTLTNGIACTGPSKTFTITVNPKPLVTSTIPKTICSGDSANYPLTSNIAGTTFTWPAPTISGSITGANARTSGASTPIGDILTNSGTAPATVTYAVTPTANNCAGSTTSIVITVNPKGQVNQPSNQTVCAGSASTPVIFDTTNIVGTTTYNWTNNTPAIGLAASGTGNIPAFTATPSGSNPITATITVTPTFTNGIACTGPAKTFTITVNPQPSVTVLASQDPILKGQSCILTAFGASTYEWFDGSRKLTPEGTNSSLMKVSPRSTTTYTVIGDISGCKNTAQVTVTVKPLGIFIT